MEARNAGNMPMTGSAAPKTYKNIAKPYNERTKPARANQQYSPDDLQAWVFRRESLSQPSAGD
jgi:hypothetical protein